MELTRDSTSIFFIDVKQSVGDEEKGWKNSRMIRTGHEELYAGNHTPSNSLQQKNLQIIAAIYAADRED